MAQNAARTESVSSTSTYVPVETLEDKLDVDDDLRRSMEDAKSIDSEDDLASLNEFSLR